MKNRTDGTNPHVANKKIRQSLFSIKPNPKDTVNGNLGLLPLSSAKTARNGNAKDTEKNSLIWDNDHFTIRI